MFAALRSARLRFFLCFPQKNSGETGAPRPWLPRTQVSPAARGKTKLACVERGVTLPFRRQGKILPCRRSLVTALPCHQPSDRYGGFANEPGSARCLFANLPCRQGKTRESRKGFDVTEGDEAAPMARHPRRRVPAGARNRTSSLEEPYHGAGSIARPGSEARPRVFAHK
jgi:hypothetical protein